jgi:putative membrane protein
MLFSQDEHARIAAAITQAETRTSGEIFAIVTDKRPRYGKVALAAAALCAFALPLIAVLLGFDPQTLIPYDGGWRSGVEQVDLLRTIEAYAALQAAIFLAVLALMRWTPLGLVLAPRGVKRDRVHREALRQFLAKGLHVTAERTGVLLYVSLAEHQAEVIADEGIYAKVAPDIWGEAVAALVDGIKSGRRADGFVRAIELAGEVLAQHFPPRPHNPNELPDKLVEV